MPDETKPQRAHRQVTYRLLPQTRDNWRRLERVLEAQRQLYNAALQERSDAWRLAGVSLTWQDQFRSLTACRREIPEMAAVPVAIQRGTLKRVDEAFRGFFRRARAGQKPGYPRFRGRRRFNSISVYSGVRVEAGRLRLPGFGWMTVRRRGGTPYPDARPVSAVLRREAGRWYAVVCHAVAVAQPEDDGTAIGIDMNAGQVAASDGRLFHAPDTRRLEARKRRYQRMVARRRRASHRRDRARRRLARTARRIAMARRDWHHQVSRRIAEGAHTVAIEDLKVRNMTASARGTAEEPGTNVRAKAGLNRVILDTGWAALRAMLDYKAARVIAVDPRHTSRTCAACGHVDARSRRSQAVFHCVACGHADNADANAARNIRRRGLALLHGEAAGVPGRGTVNTRRRMAA